MKTVFCIVGMTGSGKTTVLDYLLSHFKDLDMGRLIYHTTRRKRYHETDGVDYYFEPEYDSEEFNKKYNKDEVIESRYYEKANEKVLYYTTYDDINNAKNEILLCAASVDQLLEYSKHIENVYAISLDLPLVDRLQRLISRNNSDDEIKETCRRVVEETVEYDKLKLFDQSKIFKVNNPTLPDNEYYKFEALMETVYNFIKSTAEDNSHLINLNSLN